VRAIYCCRQPSSNCIFQRARTRAARIAAILTLIIFLLAFESAHAIFSTLTFCLAKNNEPEQVSEHRISAWLLYSIEFARCAAISLSDAGLIWPILVVSGATGNNLYSRRRVRVYMHASLLNSSHCYTLADC
jgi:hypothetical protein